MAQKIILFIIVLASPITVYGQTVKAESKRVVDLKNNQQLLLFESDRNPNAYYYLPTNFRAATENNQPQVSFLSFDENNDGEVDGAIMHLLLTWGPTSDQLEEANNWLINNVDSSATIWGGINVTAIKAKPWEIIADKDNTLVELLLNTINSNSNIPNISGGKWAASFRFNAEQTEQMKNLLGDKKMLEQTFFSFNYAYSVLEEKGYFRRTKTYSLTLTSSIFDLIGIIK